MTDPRRRENAVAEKRAAAAFAIARDPRVKFERKIRAAKSKLVQARDRIDEAIAIVEALSK